MDAFEGGVRIPLVIAGPGIKNGSESATPVSGSGSLAYHNRFSWK